MQPGTGGEEARDGAEEPHRASDGGRAEELNNTCRTSGFRGLDRTSGDGTNKSGRNTVGGRFPDRTRASRRDSGKGKDSRVGTREGNGSADHRSIRQRSAPGSEMD